MKYYGLPIVYVDYRSQKATRGDRFEARSSDCALTSLNTFLYYTNMKKLSAAKFNEQLKWNNLQFDRNNIGYEFETVAPQLASTAKYYFN
ncbi:hypothetical protein TNCV_1166811 [Trichonephila clavipes]|uniref:Uncharacterized protein n=1 Tax=Trichonephila clavipes TaxID=2585209 RepID=A0A8X6VSQ0_TRICX|nr:hypothetical protein TNCV_1166811 [Trichonephila clavipes]